MLEYTWEVALTRKLDREPSSDDEHLKLKIESVSEAVNKLRDHHIEWKHEESRAYVFSTRLKSWYMLWPRVSLRFPEPAVIDVCISYVSGDGDIARALTEQLLHFNIQCILSVEATSQCLPAVVKVLVSLLTPNYFRMFGPKVPLALCRAQCKHIAAVVSCNNNDKDATDLIQELAAELEQKVEQPQQQSPQQQQQQQPQHVLVADDLDSITTLYYTQNLNHSFLRILQTQQLDNNCTMAVDGEAKTEASYSIAGTPLCDGVDGVGVGVGASDLGADIDFLLKQTAVPIVVDNDVPWLSSVMDLVRVMTPAVLNRSDLIC